MALKGQCSPLNEAIGSDNTALHVNTLSLFPQRSSCEYPITVSTTILLTEIKTSIFRESNSD